MAVFRRATTMVALILALTACAPPPDAAPALAGTAWVVTTISAAPTLTERRPHIAFAATTVSGTSGCNGFSGSYSRSHDSLTFSPLVITAMACSPAAVMDQETALTAALSTVTNATGSASGLTLTDATGKTVLTLEPDPSPSPSTAAALNRTWRLTTITSHATSSSTIAGSEVSLTIDTAAGHYSGHACNRFGGDLVLNGDAITFGAPASTKMACVPASLDTQEATVLNFLKRMTSWRVTDGRLSLTAADGAGLEFEAQ